MIRRSKIWGWPVVIALLALGLALIALLPSPSAGLALLVAPLVWRGFVD